MSLLDTPTWTRTANPRAGTRPDATASRAREALGFLLPEGAHRLKELRRTTVALTTLGALAVFLLNAGIYQAAYERTAKRIRAQLVHLTEMKRQQLEGDLEEKQRQTEFLADDDDIAAAARLAARGALEESRRSALVRTLDEARSALDLNRLELVVGGIVMASARSLPVERRQDAAALCRRAASTKKIALGELLQPKGERAAWLIAVPMKEVGEGAMVPVLLVQAPLDVAVQSVLGDWPGLGPEAQGYLARRVGNEVAIMSLARGHVERIPVTSPRARTAMMAAAGVESDLDQVTRGAPSSLACTRFLAAGYGIVGEVPQAVVRREMSIVITGLLLLDCAMLLGAAVTLWLWRRRYAAGLAQREMEVSRRHAERVQAVFDTAFDAILTLDRHGLVRTANLAAERLFGHGAAALKDQPLARFLRWESAGDLSGGRPPQLPPLGLVVMAEARRSDGHTFPAEITLAQAGEGDDSFYTAIMRDIGDRVRAEQQIRQFAESLERSNRRLEELNAQLEGASRLKSEFLANTSHELRTPLNGMIGFLQLVLDGMCQGAEEEREFLKQALSCSRHLLGLINDVLDIAKIEAGKLNLEITAVDVDQLFQEVYALTHVQAAQKGIVLRAAPIANAPSVVRADFNKTKQVLINLVGNSIKFTEKGSVTMKATAHPELGHVMFEITDTGIGIPSEQQKVIFEKFTQGDGSTTRRYGGTGLGLAISKSLVELMGGIIGVHSDGQGKGTRLYFSLPSWSQPQSQPDEVEETGRITGPPNGPLVLVVDDDPTFRQYLRALLHGQGYRTVEAASAEQGWVLTRRHLPGAMVLDYALSCGEDAHLRTGWDLAQNVAAVPDTRHIPIIFVTGFDAELREKLRSTAFSRRPEYLMKPVDGTALRAKIEEVLGPRMHRTVRVLLVDDDPAIAAFVRKVLPESRFQMEMARNGEECLHILRTQPEGFDLLLLDLMMPEVSGYDVLREMVLTHTASELPVLVLTNFPSPRNDEEKRLLKEGLVLEVLPKTSVHENPLLLAHILNWHLQVAMEEKQQEAA